MSSVSQVGKQMEWVLEERACVLARATGCVKRQRKFSGADVVQMLVFGFQQHPHASLEELASTAEIRDVSVTDSAVDKRFTPACARLLHAIVEELTSVVVEAAQDVPIRLLRRFSAVILEDSSSITLPDELVDQWRGCGGTQEHTAATVKLHVRWELKRGRLWGPTLTDGRTSDRSSPFNQQEVVPGSLYVEDLGYFNQSRLAERHQAGTALYTPKGQRLDVLDVVPRRVGQMKELRVLVGARERLPMRLLMLRVPKEVADKRREDLLRDGQRRQQTISEATLQLADWTILVTDVPAKRLRFEEALVLLRERWQMELLYKLWKQYGQVDEWHTADPWRVLCELYAKLIGLLLQHWLIVLFAWHDPQRSLVKLAKVVRDMSWTLMDPLAHKRSVRAALRLIGRRMRSGCHMNKRKKHPNSAQLMEQEAVEWALSWCE
jgi:Transposase DDE domain